LRPDYAAAQVHMQHPLPVAHRWPARQSAQLLRDRLEARPGQSWPDPEPATDRRGRRRYVTTRKEGIHQLRHYYASVMLAGGVSIKELAEYLGHSDPAFTLRVYAHMLPCSHERARAVISERFAPATGIDV
jgi:integrase